ncbi:hypothetical protein A3J61_00920 [Candidatus Nomurabacteria bacterium RIFCSPHIGHO2_02_FULL_38_15]|uniref:Peptidase M16 N-terminal domain-containing protein n=1 Tax=Candidatus Nomurabacteria bacterium RIFCSPHIGHO2_02_FULL_38_15 TaxID=1801752 RepID=A0A1F6VRA4_9BACT|nr:MAG: hypothetical protein A3J61_00920 [Candidatus Nomurabacteria bacterium RIFCSPHIGHO2_02_FULL_38_15]
MKDRLDYIKYTLKNGLTLVYLPMDVEFNTIDYTLPFGHLNNTGQFPGGTFHFLEHMCFHRSKLYPKKDSFEKFLASIGSKINAATSNNFTKYYLSVPSQEIEPALTGLLSHIFNPIIDENDINIERGIIKNERRRLEAFFPGKNEIEKYEKSKWLFRSQSSLEQRLGSDTSLEKINKNILEKALEYYKTKNSTIFIGGNCDIDRIISIFENIDTKTIQNLEKVPAEKVYWVNKKFHKKYFSSTSRPSINIAGLSTYANHKELFQLSLLASYFTDNIYGVLHNWLRKDKGWTYETNTNVNFFDSQQVVVEIILPIQDERHVDEILKIIKNKITDSISDSSNFSKYIEKSLLGRVFLLQTLPDRKNTLLNTFLYQDTLEKETVYVDYTKEFLDTNYVKMFFEKKFKEFDFGVYVSVPKKKVLLKNFLAKIKRRL